MKSISGFWKMYDIRFFSHKIPCDIEYPLALPLPDSLQGVDYINRYLADLWCENRFLSEYEADDMAPVLARYCPGFEDLPVNLFEPIAANALALAILERRPDRPFRLGARDLEALYDLFQHMDRAEIRRCLDRGADRLWEEHPAFTSNVRAYFSRYCGYLAPRIDLLRDSGGLGGIFSVT